MGASAIFRTRSVIPQCARISFAVAPGERNDDAFAVVQLNADLAACVGSDLPSVFKGDPGATLQRAPCDPFGIKLDEEGIAFPYAPQFPNA